MKYLRIAFIFIVSIVLLSACSSGVNDDNSKEKQKETDEKWQEIKDKGELVVGTSGTLIAASYYDGDKKSEDQLTGYDVEVMREVAKRLDLDISFEIMGIDSMLPAIKSGRIDVAANDIEATDKRKESFNFSEPYKYSYSTMVVRKDDNSGIESLEDLKGKKAGGGATTIYSQIAEHFGAEVVTYGNAPNEAYLRDVHNGRTDVIVNDYYLSKFGVAGFPEFDIHLHPNLKFHPTEQAVVIPQGADTLTEKINHTLSEMREDRTLTELATKFYQEDASQKPKGDIKPIDGLDL
ncbi:MULTISPECIES: transporter substrate-binding domain-containing protein [Clostridia]|uniref:transporter substrate-binding domain-containing protein n=1 Tax=Clostridia TaxID=186801 RepID=UPI000EA1978C|nr:MULTISPECIES: transporter substrate-binding domain-containing protein [Clostridia]NBJ70139.1 amino acid ABC transporter substrate-binding protein [Roseburia sp. 1XD42-34]RKI77096.1 amino acid ABC transporter substrate-binding protein [Clostridium sp. 1xD42-85]